MLHSGCDSHWSSEPSLTSDLVLLNPMDVFAVLVLPDLCSILVVGFGNLGFNWLLATPSVSSSSQPNDGVL